MKISVPGLFLFPDFDFKKRPKTNISYFRKNCHSNISELRNIDSKNDFMTLLIKYIRIGIRFEILPSKTNKNNHV